MASTSSGAVIFLVVAALLLFGGGWAISASFGEAGDETEVTETVTQSTDEQTLEAAADYDRFLGVTVTGPDGELDHDDYSWDRETGTISFDEDSDDEVDIKTVGQEFDENTNAFARVIGPLWYIMVGIPFIAGAGAIFAGLKVLEKSSKGGGPI